MQLAERITFNPNQSGGRPCIRGMRIRVKDVLDLLAAGVPETEILEDYPYLEADDIRACLEYAAQESGLSLNARPALSDRRRKQDYTLSASLRAPRPALTTCAASTNLNPSSGNTTRNSLPLGMKNM